MDVRIRTAASFGVSVCLFVCLLIGYTVTRPANLMLLAKVGNYGKQFGIQELHAGYKDKIQSVSCNLPRVHKCKNNILFVSLLHDFD